MTLDKMTYPHLGQDLYQAVLENGLKLIVLPKPGFKETVAFLQVAVGGVDKTFTRDGNLVDTPYGLAHFLEHQVFENFGQADFSQQLTALGSDSNAFTGFTSTNYFFSGRDKIRESLGVLLDMVSQARFTDQSITKERAVIKQELDMYQDDPDHRLYSSVLTGLYPDSPLAVDLAGTVDSLDATDRDLLELVFDSFYRPDLMTLVVVGDLIPEEVYSWLTDLSTQLPKREPIQLVRSAIDHKPVLKKQSFQMDVALPKLGLGFRTPPSDEPALFYKTALRLYLNMLLGWTSETYQAWYDQGRVDDSFDVTIEVTPDFQFVMVLLDTQEPIGMASKIKQALKKGRGNKDLTEDHLFTLKKEMYGEFLMSLDRVDELASLYLEHSGEDVSYLDFPDVLDELSLEVVIGIGQAFFEAAEVTEVTIFPN